MTQLSLATIQTEATSLLARFTKLAIRTQADIDAADAQRRTLGLLIKRVDARRKEEKQPHLDAGAEVDAKYKQVLTDLRQCETLLLSKTKALLAEQRAEQDKALAAVSRSGGEVSKDTLALAHGAEQLRAPAGLREKSELDFEITDEDMVPARFKSVDRELVMAEIARTRGGCKIPGIKVVRRTDYQRKGVVQR